MRYVKGFLISFFKFLLFILLIPFAFVLFCFLFLIEFILTSVFGFFYDDVFINPLDEFCSKFIDFWFGLLGAI